MTITGTHSPEGQETINSKLAEQRAQAIEKYYRGQMKKFDYQTKADSIEFTPKAIVQDWAMLKDSLAASASLTQEQKDQVLAVVDGSGGDFVTKERDLRKFPFYRKMLSEVYPKLRTAETEILSLVTKMPDAELFTVAKSIATGGSSDSLSGKELGYAATLTPDLTEKLAIYNAWAKQTDGWEAHNNVGATLRSKPKRTLTKRPWPSRWTKPLRTCKCPTPRRKTPRPTTTWPPPTR